MLLSDVRGVICLAFYSNLAAQGVSASKVTVSLALWQCLFLYIVANITYYIWKSYILFQSLKIQFLSIRQTYLGYCCKYSPNIIVGWLGCLCNKVNLNSYMVTPSSLRALFKSQHCTFNAWQASGIITRLVDMGFDFS